MTDLLDVARLRLRNTGLGGAFTEPAEVVGWHLGMQSQDYGPARWSIAQRAPQVSDEDIEGAVSGGSIVRTHVLRETWHFVHRDDLRWLLALTGPRIQQTATGRYRQLGLDQRTRERSYRAISSALGGGRMLTRNQLGEILEQSGIDTAGQRLPHMLMDAELEALICSGGRSGKHHTYALADERLPPARPFDRDEAVVELVRRYLASHGPAGVHDLGWWASLTLSDIRRAIAELDDELETRTVDGTELWMVAGTSDLAEPSPRAHLLQTYDELIVGYTKTRFFGDPRQDAARAAWQDRSLPNGLVLIDALVAGHWRRTIGTKKVSVDVRLYDDPSRRDRKSVETAADDLAAFLGLDLDLEIGRI